MGEATTCPKNAAMTAPALGPSLPLDCSLTPRHLATDATALQNSSAEGPHCPVVQSSGQLFVFILFDLLLLPETLSSEGRLVTLDLTGSPFTFQTMFSFIPLLAFLPFLSANQRHLLGS